VLVEHPRVRVEAAVHRRLPVALVGQHVVLEASSAGLSGCDPVCTLVVDVALVHIGEVSLWGGTLIVRVPLATHQVLLYGGAQVPVGAGDVHQPGQGIVPGQVVHL